LKLRVKEDAKCKLCLKSIVLEYIKPNYTFFTLRAFVDYSDCPTLREAFKELLKVEMV